MTNSDEHSHLSQQAPQAEETFGRLNWVLLIVGLVLLVVGFLTLTQVDPEANNLAGILAPVLIIGSYIIIFISVIIKE
jgi:CHASE3 domain sensor protein